MNHDDPIEQRLARLVGMTRIKARWMGAGLVLLTCLGAPLVGGCGGDETDGNGSTTATGTGTSTGGPSVHGSCDGWYSGEGFEARACIDLADTYDESECRNNWEGTYEEGGRCTGDAYASCSTDLMTFWLTAPRAGSEATWRRICERLDNGQFELLRPMTTTDPAPSTGVFTTLTGPAHNPDFAHITNAGAIWLSSREAIIGSNDSGLSWHTTAAFPGSHRRRTYFVDESRGFVVDDSCEFRSTADGGDTWAVSSSTGLGGCEDIAFAADGLHGFVPAGGGQVAATSDGGSTWTSQSSGTTATLRAVAVRSAERAWVVGNDGAIAATTNGGTSWTPQVSGTSVALMAITAVDDLVAVAVGDDGTVVRTTDGGAAWTMVTSPDSTAALVSVSFSSATEGWVGTADSDLHHTNDGGANWVAISLPDEGARVGAVRATSAAAVDVVAFDTNAGFWGVYRTTNGGQTWTRSAFGASLGSIAFSGERGIATGRSGILVTDDGGSTWSRTWSSSSISAVAMSDADRAIAAGGNPVTVYVTDDGGHTWTPSGASLDEGVRWIGLFGANDGWAAGAAAVHKTSDGGASWTLVKERPGHDDGYTGVQFWSADAMAIADVEDGLIETTDGGVSWTDGTGTFFQGGPRGLAFADEQNGYLLSRDDQDSRFQTRTHLTEDGGTTFRRTVLPLAMGGTSEIVFATSSLGLSLGDRLFVTRDGGASWVPASDRGAASGVAVSASEVWLVGEAGLTHGVGVGD